MLSIRIHLEHLKPLQGLDYGFSFSTVLSTVDYKSFLILNRNLKQELSEKQRKAIHCVWIDTLYSEGLKLQDISRVTLCLA